MLNGFCIKCMLEFFVIFWRNVSSAYPEIKIVLRLGIVSDSFLLRVGPSILGIKTSVIKRSNASFCAISIACVPQFASITLYPLFLSALQANSRILSSSSTNKIV